MSDGGGVKTLPVMFLGREHKKPRSELFLRIRSLYIFVRVIQDSHRVHFFFFFHTQT